MSKFCGSCGANMEDDAKVCGACGAPIETENATNPVDPTNPVNPTNPVAPMSEDQKKKITLIAVAAGAGFVALIAIIIVVNLLLANTGYKGTVNKYFKAYGKEDIKTVAELTSDLNYAYYLEDLDDEELAEKKEEAVEDSLDYLYEEYENKVGDKIKIKCEIVDANEISERKFDSFIEELEDDYDYNTSEISKVVKVDYNLEIKGKKGERTERGNDLYLIKEDGKWTVYHGSLLY